MRVAQNKMLKLNAKKESHIDLIQSLLGPQAGDLWVVVYV
jgi:hypothetical protein